MAFLQEKVAILAAFSYIVQPLLGTSSGHTPVEQQRPAE